MFLLCLTSTWCSDGRAIRAVIVLSKLVPMSLIYLATDWRQKEECVLTNHTSSAGCSVCTALDWNSAIWEFIKRKWTLKSTDCPSLLGFPSLHELLAELQRDCILHSVKIKCRAVKQMCGWPKSRTRWRTAGSPVRSNQCNASSKTSGERWW